MIQKEWNALVGLQTPVKATEAFCAHWQQQKQKAAQYGSLGRLPYETGNEMAIYETLTFDGTDGVTLSARYLRPSDREKAPLVLMFHDAGRPVRGWHHMTRFIALGYSVLALQNRPEGGTVEQMYTDAFTAAQVALHLPSTQQIFTWGEGLGGTLAIAAAAFFDAEKCAVQNPLCSGAWEDCACFASLLRCPLLMATCGMDEIAPPESQAVVCASAGGTVKHLLYPKYVHDRINAYEDQLLTFLHPDTEIPSNC